MEAKRKTKSDMSAIDCNALRLMGLLSLHSEALKGCPKDPCLQAIRALICDQPFSFLIFCNFEGLIPFGKFADVLIFTNFRSSSFQCLS